MYVFLISDSDHFPIFSILFTASWSWNRPFCMICALFATFWSWNPFGMLFASCCWLLVVGCCLLVVGSCLFCYYCCSWSCCSCCSFCSCSCSCCCNALFVVAVVVTVSVLCAVGEAKKSVKLCGTKKTENSRNYQGKNNRERHTSVCVVFAIFLAFCNVNLHCGRKTSNFAWHVRHLEDRPFHVAWRMVFAEFCK